MFTVTFCFEKHYNSIAYYIGQLHNGSAHFTIHLNPVVWYCFDPNVGLMLVRRRRRRTNISLTLASAYRTLHRRTPIYWIISKYFDLTLCHTSKQLLWFVRPRQRSASVSLHTSTCQRLCGWILRREKKTSIAIPSKLSTFEMNPCFVTVSFRAVLYQSWILGFCSASG